VSGATSYNVYASTGAGAELQQTTGITGTTWTDTAAALAAGTVALPGSSPNPSVSTSAPRASGSAPQRP
jgi:hypothetical protein